MARNLTESREKLNQKHNIGRRRVITSRGRSLRFERLERRLLLFSEGIGGSPEISDALNLPANIDGHLAELLRSSVQESLSARATSSVDSVVTTKPRESLGGLLQFDETGNPLVSVWTRANATDVAAQLATLGATIYSTSDQYHLIEASFSIADLPVIAAMTDVLSLTPIYRPLARAGIVQTQGDAVLNADDVRAFGFDGAAILVGVLSDSALNIGISQATGDLPAIVDRYLEFPNADEGRAMLEIIHDIAPGAKLAHHSASLSELSFADGIRKLATAGSRVIVDDVGYYTEPFFQDGIVAQAVDEVTATGVVYVSAAGNDANRAYETVFVDADPGSAADFQDFDPSVGVDTRQQVTVPAGYRATLILQWDNPFYTANGVTHDFDVKVYDDTGTLVETGANNNVALQQPLEIVQWDASGNGVYQVEIERQAGNGASVLKYVLSTNSEVGTIDEYATSSGTVTGHAAAAGAIAVGAVPYYSPDSIEPYSSWGDVTIYFDAAGNRLTIPELRHKPDVVAPDNVNTSFFGVDIPEDPDAFKNFAGTSAAAPHVAGVVALMLDVNPHLTRDELYSVVTTTAVDLGAAGQDSVYGFGRVDAEAARVAAAAVTDVTAPTASLLSPISAHGWHVNQVQIKFSEPLNNATASSSSNYTLVAAGTDNTFDTGDDVVFTVAPSYDADVRVVTLTFIGPAIELADDQYRLILDGTNGLKDETGNDLNQGGDQDLFFSIAPKSDVISAEGAGQLDARPDGTAVVVYPNNPGLNGLKWPQVMIGSLYPGGVPQGPFRSAPTDQLDSFRVENPDVAVNGNSGVVVYSNLEGLGGDGSPLFYLIGYQMLGADGRPSGTSRLAGISGGENRARVEMTASGAFTIVFADRDYNSATDRYDLYYIRARQFDAAGNPLGSVFTVSQQTGGIDPAIAILANGSQVYVWERSGNIIGRRFDATGSPLGDEFIVATPGQSKLKPEIGRAVDGSFVVAWQTFGGIYYQRFDASAVAVGETTQVFVTQSAPQVAVASDGRFIVAWHSEDGAESGIFAQRFNAIGSIVGDRIWVNEDPTGDQTSPRVAILDNGNFVISWQDSGGGRAKWYSWDVTDEV
ncbi:MAG: subtilisin family serine protease, partial [Pirellulaceae bacterium]